MNSATVKTPASEEPGVLQRALRSAAGGRAQPEASEQIAAGPTPWWQRFPGPPMALTAVFFALMLVPPVRDNPRLIWTFAGVGGVLLAWEALLWALAAPSGRLFRIEWYPIKAHWVQGIVQSTILLYWGWHVDMVYPELPLIFSQLVFLYAIDALLSWSRGRSWRLGFAPLPVIISTNLLLWFRHDWYYYQFLMLFTGALAKNFLTWRREGRQTHIFNPSALGQFVFAIALLATGTTDELTRGTEIARTFEVPHMLIVIFLVGLVVQFMFHVTLMTVAAVAALYALNHAYTWATGTYFFIDINIAAPIFLGVHLLITDPATSPRTLTGRVIFGLLYGSAYFALFRVLDWYGVPLFWDKLLPVPILNLCVPLIDRAVHSGMVGRLNRAWENALPRPRLNLIHMGLWCAFFGMMLLTGYIEAPHPGNSVAFWKKAFLEGRHYAGENLAKIAYTEAVGGHSGDAYNELGLIYQSGSVAAVHQNDAKAAEAFGNACRHGSIHGCANVVIQFLFLRQHISEEDVARALDGLEADCSKEPDWGTCYLIGAAYETGRGRPMNLEAAIHYYERCGFNNIYACKGIARIVLSGKGPPYDLRKVIPTLAWESEKGDAESCWYIAYMYHTGNGLRPDEAKARALLERACGLGMAQACEAMKQEEFPPFRNPPMIVPGWSSSMPAL